MTPRKWVFIHNPKGARPQKFIGDDQEDVCSAVSMKLGFKPQMSDIKLERQNDAWGDAPMYTGDNV